MRTRRLLLAVLVLAVTACSNDAAPEQASSVVGNAPTTSTTGGVAAEPDPMPVVLYRVNAGGPEIASLDGGPAWAADLGTEPSPHVNIEATPTPVTIPVDVFQTDESVPATTPKQVFGWERWDEAGPPEMAWSFPVAPSAALEVRLYFASAFDGASRAGERVFDVLVDGVTVLENFDIVSEAGHRVGTMRSVPVTADTDGLDVQFRRVLQNPEINAIEIVQLDAAQAAGSDGIGSRGVEVPPVGEPVPQVTPIDGAIPIQPGESIQAYVDQYGESVTFLLGAGTFTGQTIRPRSGQSFLGTRGPNGERLTILDGEGAAADGFLAAGASRVTISGLVLTGYTAGGVRTAAVNARFPERGRDWVIEDCDIGYSTVGVNAGPGAMVSGNLIHHNAIYGVTGQGAGLVVQGNEISYNRTDTSYDAGDSSATKFVLTTDLVVRDNWVHDNNGHGIWTDINNLGALIVGNRVEDNWWVGIFHEISYHAVIRNNLVERNGLQGYDEHSVYGIMITNSPDVEVYGNVLVDNGAGIGSRQWDHPGDHGLPDHDWRYGERVLKNLDVHDNTIIPTPS